MLPVYEKTSGSRAEEEGIQAVEARRPGETTGLVEGEASVKAPFPYFGGKSRVAALVWSRFGDPPNYVEPFCGSCAILLARPGWDIERGDWADGMPRTETVNDSNAWLCNLWRAIKADPDAVAYHAADPVSELDLHARGDWLFYRPGVDREFVERLRGDPEYCDAKSAGWWVWGQASWIGSNWSRVAHNKRKLDGVAVGVVHALPHLSRGTGVNRKRPHLSDAGRGVNRSSFPGEPGAGILETPRLAGIRAYLRQLCARLSRMRICCGDWTRVLGPTPTTHHGLTAVFFDPPYGVADRDSVYGEDEDRDVAHAVRAWCLEHGDDPLLRIVLCGYDEHALPASWTRETWRAYGGYGLQGDGTGRANRERETIWFSPGCTKTRQEVLPLCP